MRTSNRAGFVLLEAIVALAIISLISLGLLQARGQQIRVATQARELLTAQALAEDRLATLRLLNYENLEQPADSVLAGAFPAPFEDFSWMTTVEVLEDEYDLFGVDIVVTGPAERFLLGTLVHRPRAILGAAGGGDAGFGGRGGGGRGGGRGGARGGDRAGGRDAVRGGGRGGGVDAGGEQSDRDHRNRGGGGRGGGGGGGGGKPRGWTVMARQRGFTLIEVLVGLTVAALALSAGFATLAFLSDREEPVDTVSAVALRGATTRSLLIGWLSEARLQAYRRGPVFQGFDAEERGASSDELNFPTRASTPLGVGTSIVRLFIDRDTQTPEKGLVAELTERASDEPRVVELVPEAGALEISYLMPIDGSTGEWTPAWVNTRRLPKAIRLALAATAPDTLPSLLRYPILVALETTR